jgi:hypothetical protein
MFIIYQIRIKIKKRILTLQNENSVKIVKIWYNINVKEGFMKNNKFINILPIFINKKNIINIYSFCVYNKLDDSEKHLNIDIPLKFKLKKSLNIPFTSYYLNFYTTSIKIEDVYTLPIQNKITVRSDNKYEYDYVYNLLYLNKFVGARSRLNISKDNDLTFYIRQGGKNSVYLTIRKINTTDYYKQQILIILAFLASLIPTFKKYVLFFEKELNKYEESASIVFEKLIDRGYKNIYFIIKKNSDQLVSIDSKYVNNFVYANTFKHYYMFFKSKRFIGTEAMQHAFELRVASRLVMAKIAFSKFKYVFLQHGVMYMVSLDSSSRSSFRKGKGIPKNTKIVVSSKKEAQHFIDLGGFDMNDLYLTGLPKFDRAKLNKKANKIVIMPTWRPWEYNMVKTDLKSSGYYKMIMSIINNIPSELSEYIVLLPHPLISDVLFKTELSKYMPKVINYDAALRDCKLLITDYSSISYDAFYRGSNIIFWWVNKEECMRHYEGKLMLDKSDAFGDICLTEKDLSLFVAKNYYSSQDKKYIDNYRTIVEFYDNNNTERLIDLLIKDKFI